MTLGDVLVSVFRRSRWRRSKYNINGNFDDNDIKCLSMTDLSNTQVIHRNTFVCSQSAENLLECSKNTYYKKRRSYITESNVSLPFSNSQIYKKRPQSCFIDYGSTKTDMFNSSVHTDNDQESMDRSTDSVLCLIRRSSIQDKSLRIMRRRHQNVKKRSRDSQLLSDGENDDDSSNYRQTARKPKVENRRSVHFDDVDVNDEKLSNTKPLSVSTSSLYRNNSVQLKSWEIRRQRRAMFNKHKRASRLLMYQENLKYEERLV